MSVLYLPWIFSDSCNISRLLVLRPIQYIGLLHKNYNVLLRYCQAISEYSATFPSIFHPPTNDILIETEESDRISSKYYINSSRRQERPPRIPAPDADSRKVEDNSHAGTGPVRSGQISPHLRCQAYNMRLRGRQLKSRGNYTVKREIPNKGGWVNRESSIKR